MTPMPEDMTCTEDVYPALALRTLCPDAQIDLTKVDHHLFMKIVSDFIAAAQKLDMLKKVTVYGRDLPGMASPEPFKAAAGAGVDPQIYHAILGIATEGGELMEALVGTLVTGQQLDVLNVVEELGDLEWFEALLRDRLKVPPGVVRGANIRKLEARYAKKVFDAQAAEHRDHDAERKAMQ